MLAEPRGWRLLALALGLMLLAGFPESAYLCGLLVLAFAVVRWAQCPAAARFPMIVRVGLGGCVGLALAAPQLLPFLQFLPNAYLGGHAAAFAHTALVPEAAIPSLLAPYAFGPIFAYTAKWPTLSRPLAQHGGYFDLFMLALDLASSVARSA